MPLTDCPQPQLRQAQQLIPIEPGKLGNRLRAIVFYFFLSHNHDGTEPSPTIKYHHITRKHPTRYYVKSRKSSHDDPRLNQITKPEPPNPSDCEPILTYRPLNLYYEPTLMVRSATM
jgi:hypothetical protein